MYVCISVFSIPNFKNFRAKVNYHARTHELRPICSIWRTDAYVSLATNFFKFLDVKRSEDGILAPKIWQCNSIEWNLAIRNFLRSDIIDYVPSSSLLVDLTAKSRNNICATHKNDIQLTVIQWQKWNLPLTRECLKLLNGNVLSVVSWSLSDAKSTKFDWCVEMSTEPWCMLSEAN